MPTETDRLCDERPEWQKDDQSPADRRAARICQIITCVLWVSFVAILASWISNIITPPIVRWIEGKHPSSAQPYPALPLEAIPKRLQKFQDCSIGNIRATNMTFGVNARPISVADFVERRDRLAAALTIDKLDAFVVEPGYTFSYYANVTQPDWEVWEPEERPFLMIVQPYHVYDEKGIPSTLANTTFLVPSFEEERARLLKMPFNEPISTITYEEHWNPYRTLMKSELLSKSSGKRKIMVDEEMRDFISRGLADSGFDVVGLNGTVEQVRQRKTAAEIEILRAVNTGTVEAVRAMRKCMTAGLIEDDVTVVLDNTLRAAGLDPFFDIVLFDEDASNPHGGTDGTKALNNETMVLIDVGAHLYGYSSDICRSFFPPFTSRPLTRTDREDLSDRMQEKWRVWETVYAAQTAAMSALRVNSSAAMADIAARDVIRDAGYGAAFTHRVGHGIGIKAHESPYLHKGNTETCLKAGMTFTVEPGVYLVDKFGVRHEDVVMVREGSYPELLTGQRARGPWDP